MGGATAGQKADWRRAESLAPGLKRLRHEAATYAPEPGETATDAWYRRFKPLVTRLVGWHRAEPGPAWLFSVEAYDAATAVIGRALDERFAAVALLEREEVGTR